MSGPMWIRPDSARRKPSATITASSAGNIGKSPSARFTLATVPDARRFLIRITNVGSSCPGSISPRKVRFGSAPETTASAAISSPSARTTPVAVPSFTRICATSAFTRISAPALRADSASACVSAPNPPRGKEAEPTGCGSAAARRSSTAVEPADQGPSAVPKIPRAAIVARSSSVSKNSATKSATAIGPQRSKLNMRLLPSERKSRPTLKRLQRSSVEGLSIEGGVIARSGISSTQASPSASANC